MPDSKAKKAWDAANTRREVLKLNRHTDADILAWLDQQESKQGAIKQAIREHLSDSHLAGEKE